jgi:DNA-binding Lrp family transcriptional regulator
MMNAAAYRLLNDYQRGFPLCKRPYAEIAARYGLDERQVLETYRGLLAGGALGRIGVVFRPNTVGASTLAALAVPGADLVRVAEIVSAQPEVNHNYEREHRWNLWFVVAAPDEAGVAAALGRIGTATGRDPLRLPLVEEYHIDLGFDLENGEVPRAAWQAREAVKLTQRERRLVAALEHGLPVLPDPYAALARAADLDEQEVIELLRTWIDRGIARRIGAVVRHRVLGYTANAMVVWDVPANRVAAAGRRAAAHPAVTLCYRRVRQAAWRYNLYCMVHGRERARVRQTVEELTDAAGLRGCLREMLFSVRCFTQRGARYGAAAGG